MKTSDQIESMEQQGKPHSPLPKQISIGTCGFVDENGHDLPLNTQSEIVRRYNNAEKLAKALKKARETIFALHGEVAWPEYQHSPEMKMISAALAAWEAAQK